MRLFNVHTYTFDLFHTEIPAYVIASHRWIGNTETSFQDVEKQRNTHKEGYKKLEGFAEYVKEHMPHIKWLWIDTCCINKRDAAELSEAINSMFRWYQNAEVCLAYLVDVSDTKDEQSLSRSEWFTRGWTLQELIAPRMAVFLTKDWKVIGHKGVERRDDIGFMSVGRSLMPVLALRTGIPEAVLKDPSQLEDFGKEERLHWVSGRSTTREEDMSYCLFGILDVAIGANYGEGAERARRRLLAEVGLINTARPQPRPTSNVPYRRDTNYVERPGLTDQLTARLSQLAGRAALVGLGGVGKSQLAIEYSYSLRARFPDVWVLWVHASNAARFEHSVQDVADLIKIPRHHEAKPDLLELLWRWLRDDRNGKWLVVLDNADNVDFLLEPPTTTERGRKQRIEYFPVCNHGSVLFTTRSRREALRLVYENDIINVMPMAETEAEALLVSKLGRPSSEDSLLVRALDNMPLAISQAAAYIRERRPRCSVQQYCEQIEQSRQSRTSLLRRDIPLLSRDREASNAVMLTWQISFEHLYQLRRSAAELLSLMSFCDRFGVPEILIRRDAEGSETTTTLLVFNDDIVALRSFSFVSETADAQIWEMHRLVQDATQAWLEERGMFEEVLSQFVHRMYNVFPNSSYENWPICRALLPHAMNITSCQPEGREAQIEWAAIMYNAASFAEGQGDYDNASRIALSSLEIRSSELGEDDELTLWSKALVAKTYRYQGRWSKAEQLLVEVLETSRAKQGADHPNTLTSMNNLASTYSNQGRWDEAEQLQVEVLETRKAKLGADHPDTLTSMNNLASTYSNQGRWDEAEQLQVEVLETRKAKLGAGHPDTLTSMANLALTYSNQGRWDEAEQLQVEVLETGRAKLGADHPDTLMSMNNLASTYWNQGRWDKAEQLQVEVLETRKAKLGADHPDTLTSMNNLALTYWNQGRWDEAEQLQVEMLETSRAKQGADHPDTLTSMNNLAATYSSQGRWDEAEQLQVEVLETRKAKLGADHPDTLMSMNNLALTYWNQGRWDEAEQLQVEVLETSRAKLGADHPNTLTSMANLASTYWNQGRWDEAEQLLVEVLETRRAKQGADHPDTLTSMANLASTYSNQGRWDEGEQLLVEVLETRKAKLGADHPDTLTSMANLASTYRDQARWNEAEQLEVEVLDTRKAKLGADHPDTLTSMNNLALTYSNQGRWDEAEQLQVEVLEASRAKLGADHPNTLTSMANLASTYRNQGRWDEAEQLQVEVLEASRAKLGTDHPNTLTSMANLASTYRDQGRWDEAEQLQVEVLETRKAKLGADHANTLTSMANLAITYFRQKRWAEAKILQTQTVDSYKKSFGPQHPSTLEAISTLSDIQRMLEDRASKETTGRPMSSEQPQTSIKNPRAASNGLVKDKEVSEQSQRKSRWKWVDKLHIKTRK